ncbi:MAG TPA: transglycosylase domain-containing protein [Candidatus Saccharimonadia bacterium]|jgi:membrane peptidoglycan carboxypeptidase|nr:transglycosylase domain-containing protein [Candidatus Saccharimonadia bacterium]
MPKRRVRKPAKPFKDFTKHKGRIKAFFLSFTPSRFREYWISRAGLLRLGKIIGAGFLFIFLVFLWFAKDLPTPGKINARATAQTTKFYDSTGTKLIYEVYGDQNRSIITYDQIPAVAKQATIAIEDKDFYHHGSFSVLGYARAALIDLITHTRSQGGSTITQQYVKNALLDPTDHSFSRKAKELILSVEIGQFYSKNDILTLYLNEIPYGASAYGIESACKTFFPQDIDKADRDQRCAKNLDLGQSALLAAILNAPSYYSPYGANQPELIERQHLVLDLMVEQKYISKSQADAAKWTLADLSDTSKISQTQNLYANLDPRLAHFVLYAQSFLEQKYGTATVTEGGLNVRTTLDYDKQIQAYDAIQKNMKNVQNSGGSNAAMVVTDPKSGHILAMLGSHDFNDPTGGQVNVATSLRQPGSSFKPIVYSTLFAKDKDATCAKDRSCPTYGPGTTIYDVPTEFGTPAQPYHPQNYAGRNYGIITVRTALAGSLNIPAVKSLAMAGIPESIQTAQALGVDTLGKPDQYGLSLVLGTGGVQLVEMANAYESFANGGLHYEQTPILLLKDQKGNVLEDNTKPAKPKQALDPQVAGLMADILSDTNAKKFAFFNDLVVNNICGNNSSTNCVHMGVKTGTTENYRDAWTMAFTPDIVAGIWVGNNDNKAMNAAAADIAAPIYRSFMNAVIQGKPNQAFARPSGIKTVTLDKKTGRSVTAGTSDTTTDIFPSWYVPMSSVGGKSAQIDKVSGKLATECTPDLAKSTVYSSAILPEITKAENPDQYANWLAALQKAGYSTSGGDLPTDSDDVHHCNDSQPKANITGAIGGGPYDFNVEVTAGTFTPNKLEVYFDDQIISTQVINGAGSYEVTYSPTVAGTHSFKAVVTDSGLYQGTDEQSVNVTNTSGQAAFEGQTPADGSQVNSGPITFAWSNDPGATTYTLYVDNIARGSTASTSKLVLGLAPGNHSWFVRTDTSDTTDTINFKIKP